MRQPSRRGALYGSIRALVVLQPGCSRRYNYQRADSRGMMTALPQRDRTPVGPDLEPGEAERIRSLSQLAIQTAQATTNREALMAHMRALWPEGI